MALWILSGSTQVSQYQKKHSLHPLTSIVVIKYPYLLPPSTTIHGILPVQSTCFTVFSTISLQVFFGLPLGLAPSTSYSIHFFTQSLSSFHITCPYHRNLFCCSIIDFPSLGLTYNGGWCLATETDEILISRPSCEVNVK